ncbi:MAG: phosphoglycerate kinase [Candidatus Liptonbacteria bacterium]|nr:phosphoglycerate kinase [Candidatus Liptonbacteria bacterium]
MSILLLRTNLDFQPEEFSSSLRAKNFISAIKLFGRKNKIVVLSHRGRPNLSRKLSLNPFVKPISDSLGYPLAVGHPLAVKKAVKKPVYFIDVKKVGFIKTKNQIKNSANGSVFLLENLRFFPGEEKNSRGLAKNLASLGDIYINDDFASSHRKHASLVAITEFLPCFAGPSLMREINALGKVLKKTKKPFVVIVGGIKILDKLQIIQNFIRRANFVLTGGGVANTFLKAKNIDIGNSLFEKLMVKKAGSLINSSLGRKKIILPLDFKKEKNRNLDIGPKTIKKYAEIIKEARTIIWAGPMGYIEDKRFIKGTKTIIKEIIKSRAFSIIGGGETTSVMPKIKNQKSKVFISAGGGAMLEYLAGKKMPAIEALRKNGKIFTYKNKK